MPLYGVPVVLHHQHGAFLYAVRAVVYVLYGRGYVLCLIIGQEAQAAHVYAQDGSALVAHVACRLQEGAVTTHGYDKVCLEVASLYQCLRLYGYAESVGQIAVEGLVDEQRCTVLLQYADETLHAGRLLCLICIAEYGEAEFLHSCMGLYADKVT